eukprot:217977_1
MHSVVLLFVIFRTILTQYAPIVNELAQFVSSNKTFAMELNETFIEAGFGPNSTNTTTYNEMYEFYDSWLTNMPDLEHCKLVSLSTYMDPYLFTLTGYNILTYNFTYKWFSNYLNEWKIFLDSPDSTKIISQWEKCPLINMTEYVIPSNGKWNSFNEFFTREIHPTYRPISAPNNSKIIISPSDGIISIIEKGVNSSNTQFLIKGIEYNLNEILNGNEYYINKFMNGDCIQIALETYNYHRYHTPIYGNLTAVEQIGGWYYTFPPNVELNESIIPYSADTLRSWANHNRRGIAYINDDRYGIGYVANVHIGVTEVSSVNYNANIGSYLSKGDEIGFFAYGGSTILLIFEPNVIDRFTVRPFHRIKMGQQIAVAN